MQLVSCTSVLVIRLEEWGWEGKHADHLPSPPCGQRHGPCPPSSQRRGELTQVGCGLVCRSRAGPQGNFRLPRVTECVPVKYQLKWCTYFKAASGTSLSLQFIKHFDMFNSLWVSSSVFKLWFCQEFSSREENLMREISVPWSQCHTMRICVICQEYYIFCSLFVLGTMELYQWSHTSSNF